MATDIAELIGNGTLSVTQDGTPLTAEQVGGMSFYTLIGCKTMLLGKPLIMYNNAPSSYPSMSERCFYWVGTHESYRLSSQLPDFARVILESACMLAMESIKDYDQ